MNLFGNILWLIFGGLCIAVEYVVAGILLCLTIIGIPFGLQIFKLAGLAIFPFGRTTTAPAANGGCLSLFMNILWLFIGGFIICLSHFFFGILLGITIIGIPFARQHFKLATLALAPFGREIVYTR